MTPNWPDLQDLDGDELQNALSVFDRKAKAILSRGIMGENLAWPIVKWTLKDGVESGLSNPLSNGRPVGFIPLAAVNSSDGSALGVSSWKFNGTRTDGLLGITVGFSTGSATGVVTCLLVAG